MVKVARSMELNAPAGKVWEVIGGFGALADWHPAAMSCVVSERDGDTYRTITIVDGAKLEERQTARDEQARSYSYTITGGPLPVADYHSTLAVAEAGEGARVDWSSSFAAKGASDDQAARIIQGIYDAGLGALKTRFG